MLLRRKNTSFHLGSDIWWWEGVELWNPLLYDWGLIPSTANKGIFYSSPPCPDRLWGPPNLL